MSTDKVMVPALTRKSIDGWPVAEAGLPARVVHCAGNLKIKTLGELRRLPPERMLSERRFGRRSLTAIEEFFETCAEIEAGRVGFRDLREAFGHILADKSWETIRLRYGLERPEMEASRNYYTLQEIANRDRLTRERVRQVVENAMEQLHSRLAATLLSPFERMLIDVVKAEGGTADAEAFSVLAGKPVFDGLNPAAVALLLSDAHPDRWTGFGEVFVLAPTDRVEAFAGTVRRLLKGKTQPVPAAEMMKPFQDLGPIGKGERVEANLANVLQQMDDLLLFRDGSCLLAEALPDVLAAVLKEMGGKATYAEVAESLNRKLRAHCRRSSQSVHRWLSMSDLFRATGTAGRYALKTGRA